MSNCEDILDQLHRRCKGKGGYCTRPKGGMHQLCNGKKARRAAIFQRELCEGVLIGLRNDLTRQRRMKNNEQFCTDGCGIMIDGDDDVRLHCRNDNNRLRYPDGPEFGPAEIHYMIGEEYDFPGVLKVNSSRHERYVDDLTGQQLPPELCRKARGRYGRCARRVRR